MKHRKEARHTRHMHHTACSSLDFLFWWSVLRMDPGLAHARQALSHCATPRSPLPRRWSLTGPRAVSLWLGSASQVHLVSYPSHTLSGTQWHRFILHGYHSFNPCEAVCYMLLQARAAFIVGHGESNGTNMSEIGSMLSLTRSVAFVLFCFSCYKYNSYIRWKIIPLKESFQIVPWLEDSVSLSSLLPDCTLLFQP